MKINFYILFFVFFLFGCSYESIYSTKKTSFSILSLDVQNKNVLTSQITRALKAYKNSSGSRQFSLEIKAEKEKIVTSKDSKGNIKSYKLIIKCNYRIFEEGKIKKNNEKIESFVFNNDANKFKLKKYESSIETTLVGKIIEEIILELYSL